MENIDEQISAFEAKRASIAASMEEIMSKAAEEGATLDEAQQEEYDGYVKDIEAIDGHLKRLRLLEKAKAAAAKPVIKTEKPEDGSQSRAGVIQVREKQLPPGIRFARVVKCIGVAHKKHRDVEAVARELYPDDPLVHKAAVAAGSTGDSSWAGALVGDEASVFADFVEFLRPQTIVGRFGTDGIPSLRRVPFRVPLIGQTSGGAGYWVGEGKAKPLTKFDFERKTLEPLKVANIAVVTEEVLRDSSPSAEAIVRDQIAAALRERLDIDFIDPDKSASAGVSPASITNGVQAIGSSGTDADAVRADVQAVFNAFIAANNAPTSGVWIMPATTALALSLMQNPLGQAEFPGIGMNGGTFFGLPVIVSQYVPLDFGSPGGAMVALVNAMDIYLSDEGGIAVDMSREASLEMDDSPTGEAYDGASPPGVTATSLVSLWQTNSVGFRAERTINWMRRRDSAVQVLSNVNWSP